MVVAVGLVELEHGELGVVLGGDAFVAEVAVDLVDAIHAADYEALEVELGGDAELEVEIEGVVVGEEGAGGGSAGYGVHHGGFDFEVAAGVEEGAEGAEDGGSLDEDFADVEGVGGWRRRSFGCAPCGSFAQDDSFGGGGGDMWRCGGNAGVLRFAQNDTFLGRGWEWRGCWRCDRWWRGGFGGVAGVDEEVYVALAVAEFGVFEAVVLVGQGQHGLGEEGEGSVACGGGADVDGELAGAGAEEVAADADVVAEVEELVEGEGVFTLLGGAAYVVLADVDLEALAALLELREAGFALGADGHDAAGDGDFDAGGFELLAGDGRGGGVVFLLEPGDEVALLLGPAGGGDGVVVGVDGLGWGEAGLLAEGGDLAELFAAEIVEVFFELRFVHWMSFGCGVRLDVG